MPDNKMKVGKPDRDRVAAGEAYEVSYMAKKFELPAALIRKAIEREGPMRSDVEKYLRKMKK